MLPYRVKLSAPVLMSRRDGYQKCLSDRRMHRSKDGALSFQCFPVLPLLKKHYLLVCPELPVQ